MTVISFILNLGFISALLLGPSILILASWYRKYFANAVIVWRRPEAILTTVSYFIFSLILTIIGVACLFNFLRDVNVPSEPLAAERYKSVALICLSFLVSSSMFFVALRLLLVQVIVRKGIMLNHAIFRIPRPHQILLWDDICDYYTQTDYPNVIFTIIYKTEDATFQKVAIHVPSHLQTFFKNILEAKLDGDIDMPFFRFGKRKGVNGN